MRDDICTIPVSEVFEESDGCPICRMYHTVEERIIKYILGDAMMEPDVRIATNHSGFCSDHFDKMMSHRGRLQLALMLQTHIDEVNQTVFAKNFLNPPQKKAEKVKSITETCFICDKIEWGVSRMIETIYRLYETEKDFRDLFNGQPQFCMAHYERLVKGIEKRRMPRYGKDMADNLTRITKDYLTSLYEDVSKYCSMYDYRGAASGNNDWGNSKDSVERSVAFLTGRYFESK